MATERKSHAEKDLGALSMHFLRDLLYAEKQILKVLPKMARAVQSEDLRDAFMHHKEETEHQVERLHKVFETLGARARGQTCEAIEGIIQEGEDVLQEFDKGPVLDAALLANAQAVEHYEMARYGAALAWAKACGQTEVAELLGETLEEEKKADGLLSQIANKSVNKHAAELSAT